MLSSGRRRKRKRKRWGERPSASAVGFPEIEGTCEDAWGAPPGFRLCVAGLCREDSRRVTRRCAMVHLTTFLCKTYHGGHLTIRLALGGCTNRPFYRIVAAHNKCPRDGRFVEQLGSFDPLPNSNGEKLVALNLNRIRYWIGCGAHLSKPMEKLLGLSGFYPLHPMMITNAERLRRKRAQEALLASQKTESEPGETEAS